MLVLSRGNLTLDCLAESSSTHSNFNRKRDTSASGGAGSVTGKQRRISVGQPQFENPQTISGTSLHAHEGLRPATPLAAKIITFMDDLASSIVTMQAEHRPPSDCVLFGQTNDSMPVKTDLEACRFARPPWAVGSCPPGPSQTATSAIQDWVARATEPTLRK
jgi:hypothetical protein